MTSLACCSAHDEPVGVNDLRTSYNSFANSLQGSKAGRIVKANGTTRRRREFTPEEQKDDNYWLKRSRNNEAAKRSRQRKRMEEYFLETRAVELLRENEKLKAALSAVHYHGLGVKYPLGTIVEYPIAQELPRDAYLRSLVEFSGPAALTPLAETNCLSYALSGRCRSDNIMHRFSSAYDSVSFAGMTTAPIMPKVALRGDVRERGWNVGSHSGIQACNDGCSPANVLIPVAYEVSQRKGVHSNVLSTMDSSQDSFSGGFSLGGTIPNYSQLTASAPGRVTRIVMDKPFTEDSAPIIAEAKGIRKELKTIKQTERVSMSPRLPHKLRYKVNKATHGENEL